MQALINMSQYQVCLFFIDHPSVFAQRVFNFLSQNRVYPVYFGEPNISAAEGCSRNFIMVEEPEEINQFETQFKKFFYEGKCCYLVPHNFGNTSELVIRPFQRFEESENFISNVVNADDTTKTKKHVLSNDNEEPSKKSKLYDSVLNLSNVKQLQSMTLGEKSNVLHLYYSSNTINSEGIEALFSELPFLNSAVIPLFYSTSTYHIFSFNQCNIQFVSFFYQYDHKGKMVFPLEQLPRSVKTVEFARLDVDDETLLEMIYSLPESVELVKLPRKYIKTVKRQVTVGLRFAFMN